MKVIYFTKYSEKGASSRLRSVQFFPLLEKNNIQITCSSLFSDEYLIALYNNKPIKYLFLLSSYFKRLLKLISIKKYDLIVIEKELFPYLPSWFEYWLKKKDIKYIVDYDDAIFHNYDLSSNFIIKKLLSDKIDKVMKYSSCVFVGNSYLQEKAINAGALRVVILPTVIDKNRYYCMEKDNFSNKFIIGWIGSPSTFKYIKKLFPVFVELKNKYPEIKVHIIGAKPQLETTDLIDYIPWTEETEVNEINKFNVGLMPLDNTPWELGKCSYKLIQYMGCSIPLLASPVGMNKDVVEENLNGFLVSEDDWFNKIEVYIKNKDLAYIHGKNGRKLIDSKYNIGTNIEIIINEFKKIVS
ncbi:glycosyltransferase family 4 protein [Empedobacter tilapiae]